MPVFSGLGPEREITVLWVCVFKIRLVSDALG